MTAFDDLQQYMVQQYMAQRLNPDTPFFKALCEPCGGYELRGRGHFHIDLQGADGYQPTCIRYARRSRAEAALLLPEAAIPFMERGFSHTVKGWTVLGESFPVKVWHPTWLDALCAAVEAELKAKEKP